MSANPQKQLLFRANILFCMLAVIVIQGWFLYRYQQKNDQLVESMDLLELNLKEEQEKARMKYDSLQSQVSLQVNLHKRLKEELSSLQKIKAEINTLTDENKSSILRIHDIDSLRDEVARYYRR